MLKAKGERKGEQKIQLNKNQFRIGKFYFKGINCAYTHKQIQNAFK